MTKEAKEKYPAVCPHGSLERVLDNVYIVMGSFKMMPATRIGVTMTIVKRDSDLTIINSVRVSSEVEKEIEKLGTVKNVVRICANHGCWDEYYIDKFKATYYDLPGVNEAKGATQTPKADKELPELPFSDGSKVVMIEHLKYPEAVIWLPDGGGTLITGDFIQNGRPDHHSSFMGNILGRLMGFNTGCCNPPPMFFKFYGDGKDVYKPNVPAIMELDFENIVSGKFVFGQKINYYGVCFFLIFHRYSIILTIFHTLIK